MYEHILMLICETAGTIILCCVAIVVVKTLATRDDPYC